MAKVGIVTFHRAHNFGAVLQCLALKTVISNLGYDASVIDHRNPEIEQCYAIKQPIPDGLGTILKVKKWISKYLTYYRRISRFFKYDSFINKYILSPDSNLPTEKFDCIVWGSDQIWRWDIIKDDMFYWGDCGSEKPRKITYAASAGKINDCFDQNLNYLKRFDAISVRETVLKNHLLSKGISSVVTLDPTLLLSPKEWERILQISKYEEKPYLLVYSMRERKKVIGIARQIAKKENLDIIEIFNSYVSPKNIMNKYSNGGPMDFLSLIHDASIVVTDSFHGTAFSVIFNRQFITVRLNDGLDSRAEGLLKSIGLCERMKQDSKGYETWIDYTIVNEKLDRLKTFSINYLKENILPTDN